MSVTKLNWDTEKEANMCLSNALKEYAKHDVCENGKPELASLKSGDTLVVKFEEAGEYVINEPLHFECNVEIIGCEGAIIRRVWRINNNELNVSEGQRILDYVIHVSGTEENKAWVKISNVEFWVSGGFNNYNQNEDGSAIGISFFKLYHCNCVDLRNVKIIINHNGYYNNLDMRVCDNVVIKDCEFENYNQCKEGGIAWFRGSMKNILITNNVFRKFGNDEALAFWGDDYIEPSLTNKKEIIIKENIYIRNNIFEYNPDSNTYVEPPTDFKIVDYCDRLIAFNDNNIDRGVNDNNIDSGVNDNNIDRDVSVLLYKWNNISFSDNIIRINGLVHSVISSQITKNAEISNFQIVNNTIEHLNQETGAEYSSDFWIKHISNVSETNETNSASSGVAYNTSVVSKVDIVNNTVLVRDSIANNFRHSFLLINGGSVRVIGNKINPVRLNGAGQNIYKGIIAFEINENGGDILVEDSVFMGVKALIKLCQPSGPVNPIRIRGYNNTFSGSVIVYGEEGYDEESELHYAHELEMRFSNNLFYNDMNYMFDGKYSLLNACLQSNVFKNNSTPNKYFDVILNPANSMLTMSENTFVGYSGFSCPSNMLGLRVGNKIDNQIQN